MKKEKFCYFNGRIVSENKAHLSPYDIGVLRGYAVFDVMCAFDGRPFLEKEHWSRLEKSAKELGLKVPVSFDKFQKAVRKIIKLNGYRNSLVRTVLTGGISSSGYLPGKETFYILVTNFKSLPKKIYTEGAKVITLEYIRTLPEAKTTNYIIPIRHNYIKEKAGALEIFYINRSKVLEASTSNVFIVKNSKLITPDKNMLRLGTTKNFVIGLAKKNRLQVKEREVGIKELLSADEVFLTATNKDIVPVVNIDGKKIGNGGVGDITKFLMGKFEEYKKNY